MNTHPPIPRLHIGRLRLRMPGDSRESGTAVAQLLTERLAHLQVDGDAAHFGVVHLRIPGRPGMGPEVIADLVSGALGQSLARSRSSAHA
jgi:hypothetical protein